MNTVLIAPEDLAINATTQTPITEQHQLTLPDTSTHTNYVNQNIIPIDNLFINAKSNSLRKLLNPENNI